MSTHIITKTRIMHWTLRVRDRDMAIKFFREGLGMQIVGHEEFSASEPHTSGLIKDGRWSRTTMSYGSDYRSFGVHLDYGYEAPEDFNPNFGFIEIHMLGLKDRLTAHGYALKEEDEGLFTASPDGHRFKIVSRVGAGDPVRAVSLNVNSVERSQQYYSEVLGMQVFSAKPEEMVLGYAEDGCLLRLKEDPKQFYDRKMRPQGRMTIACEDADTVYTMVQKRNISGLCYPPSEATTRSGDKFRAFVLRDGNCYEVMVLTERT